jgi:S-disulfanyl-L-cysteine oxidoreductase SoxD
MFPLRARKRKRDPVLRIAVLSFSVEHTGTTPVKFWAGNPRILRRISAATAFDSGVRLVMVKCDRTASPRKVTSAAALVLAALALAAAASPQMAAAQGREQRPPAFTEGQVQRGKSIYQKNCQDCHGSTLDNGEFGGAPLKGSYFRQHWGSGDVSALFGYVNTLMPPDRPGQLTAQSYVDLTAFLLSNNGYEASTEELTADQDAQRKMTMKK